MSVRRRAGAAQRGLTLVELMIALTIGLILTAAVGYIFIASRQAFRSGEGMSRLQENTRAAVLMVNTTLRLAGYLPDPVNQTDPTSYFVAPAYAVRGGAASALATDYGLTAPTVTTGTQYVEVSYLGNADGTVRNCLGTAIGATTIVTNVFFVDNPSGDPVPSLYCATRTASVATPPPGTYSSWTKQPLVYGVTTINLRYGVDSTGDMAVDSYLDVGSVSDWTDVRSLLLTMTTVSPDVVTKADTTGSGVQADSTSRLQRTLYETIQLRNRLSK